MNAVAASIDSQPLLAWINVYRGDHCGFAHVSVSLFLGAWSVDGGPQEAHDWRASAATPLDHRYVERVVECLDACLRPALNAAAQRFASLIAASAVGAHRMCRRNLFLILLSSLFGREQARTCRPRRSAAATRCASSSCRPSAFCAAPSAPSLL